MEKILRDGKNYYYWKTCSCGSRYVYRSGDREHSCDNCHQLNSVSERFEYVINIIKRHGIKTTTIVRAAGFPSNQAFTTINYKSHNMGSVTLQRCCEIGISANWLLGYSCDIWLSGWSIDRCVAYLMQFQRINKTANRAEYIRQYNKNRRKQTG